MRRAATLLLIGAASLLTSACAEREAYDAAQNGFSVWYSTRPANFVEVMRTLERDARRCGVEIETRRGNTASDVITIADGGIVHVWIVSDANDDQRVCMSEATDTLHERLYDEPNTEEN